MNDSSQSTDLTLAMQLLFQRRPADYVVGVLVKRGHDRDASKELVQSLMRAMATAEDMRGPSDHVQKRDKRLQRLLLIHVRDGVEPPELGTYSEQERIYNSALLIREGYVRGEVIEDGGFSAQTMMTELTSKGHNLLEEPDQSLGEDKGAAAKSKKPKPEKSKAKLDSRLIFIGVPRRHGT